MSGIRASFRGSLSGFAMEVDLDLPARGVTAIYGDSGCGKTTLLRAIAGFEPELQGSVSVEGVVWQDSKTFLPTHRRSVGFVFQESSLFSHLDVRENLLFGWKRTPASLRRVPFDDVVRMMGLEALLDRKTVKLSGGERQRVAIGRALLASPRLLLMDEPLASLDRRSRLEILPFLKTLRDGIGLPILFVSHSAEEVRSLAHQVVLMESGRVLKQDTVDALAPHL